MIIYIAGKITGDSNYKEKFKRYELYYRLQGHTVLNPAVLPMSDSISYEAYIRMSKAMLDEADTIVMLPDYKDSKGALQELQWAIEQRKEVVYEQQNRAVAVRRLADNGRVELCYQKQ